MLRQTVGSNHPDTLSSLDSLATHYANHGRYADAQPLLEESLRLRRQILGETHADTMQALHSLAHFHQTRGQLSEAEPLYERVLALRQKILGPTNLYTLASMSNLAALYDSQGKPAEAEQLLTEAVRLLDGTFGASHSGTLAALNNLGTFYLSHGRADEAERLFARTLEAHRERHESNHPETMVSLHNLSGAYREQGRAVEAELTARDASEGMRAWNAEHTELAEGGFERSARSQAIFVNHLRTVAELGGTGGGGRSVTAAGFETAQALTYSTAAQAMAQMAARAASGDSALADRVRELQDMQRRLQVLDQEWLGLLSQRAGVETTGAEAGLRVEASVLRTEIDQANEALGVQFPGYNSLLGLQILMAPEAAELLHANEALLFYAAMDEVTLLWVVRASDEVALRVLPTGSAALSERVAGLREGLDPRSLDAFDTDAAYALYEDVLAPAAELLEGIGHLILIPDGPLESLPFGVLVTQPPPETPSGTFGRYREVAWLAADRAITVLPAVSALQALRETADGTPGAEPFLGFGEPLLVAGAVTGKQTAASGDGMSPGLSAAVHNLEPLPGTGDMLRAVANTLDADPSQSVITEAEATVSRVRDTALDRYRILAFATHGLLAHDDVPGLTEAALVLTPPALGTTGDHGLLTASRIVELRLNADWVLLTACNTAASDGTPGAEGLSGLARAFFYAGTRSLMVSHWYVNLDAAVALTTGLFAHTAREVPRAEALRRAMADLRNGTCTMPNGGRCPPSFAHPAMWAPFVIVGEGA